MRAKEFVTENWSAKYKRSIDCSNPKGFSQKAHCAGRKKNESVTEAKESIKDQIEKAVIVNGGDINEYFVRSADVDKLGYSAKQKFGRSPDTGDDDFSVDYVGTNKGKPALWFYPLSYYLKNATSEAYANDMPHVWLVRIKPNAWLQPVSSDNAVKQPAPNGKERVGILRKSAVPAAIFFKPAFDVVDKFYDYGSQHKQHGEVKGVAEGLAEDAGRAEAQAAYMQGECMILAVAINQLNPKRYPIGYIWEYNMSAGAPDVQMDDDEWDDLSPAEQQEISKDISRHSVVHAYVRDRDTGEYIDARGRHKTLPNLWGRLGVTRFDEFPGTARELIGITAHGDWDEVGEQVSFKRGQPAFDSLAGPAGVKRAQEYAVKYLGVEGSKNKLRMGNIVRAVVDGKRVQGEVIGISSDYKEVELWLSGVNDFNPITVNVRNIEPVSEQGVTENFADGKVKGKSRPGRVKRAGASCNGSVTDLRKKAKNASGEKAKMYHWCANMKSGKKK